jgi:transposase
MRRKHSVLPFLQLSTAAVGAYDVAMTVDGSATFFCFTPLRAPLDELLRDQDAQGSTADAVAAPAPAGPCPVCPFLEEKLKAARESAYWRAMHGRAVEREKALKVRIAELEAKVRLREQQLFGRKTETSTSTQPPPTASPIPSSSPKRPRGQQRGQPGHGRRDHSHLPAVIQEAELTGDDGCCPQCKLPFQPIGGTENTTVLEIDVRAHRRVVRRHRYRPACSCGVVPKVLTAPPPPRLIPKSTLGVSIWVTVLLDKYLFYRPTYRLLADLQSHGLDLSLGTLTDGLQRLVPLFEPLYDAFVARSRQQELWHADETRWLVFAMIEGKVGYRWYLWVFHGREVVVFVLAMGRAHDVPEEHLGPDARGIMVVDRYKAYQVIQQVKSGLIVLSFCWAHVRRDYVAVARTWSDQENWAWAWLDGIGKVYALNEARLKVRHDPPAFAAADTALRGAVTALAVQGEAELADEQLHPARRKVLESLGDHWTGLTVFVEHPEVPMDNNKAERVQRGPVVGRKNYYGSGAVWAGRLAAMMFSLFQTLTLWNINPRLWLTAYLEACAEAGGKAPPALASYLPWNLTAERRQSWTLKGEEEVSPNTS